MISFSLSRRTNIFGQTHVILDLSLLLRQLLHLTTTIGETSNQRHVVLVFLWVCFTHLSCRLCQVLSYMVQCPSFTRFPSPPTLCTMSGMAHTHQNLPLFLSMFQISLALSTVIVRA